MGLPIGTGRDVSKGTGGQSVKTYEKAADVKVGAIGYGGAFGMGGAHLNEMKRAGMTPVAVAEIDPERLKVAATEFPGIETYSSTDKMLAKSDVNLVAIITPHNTHAEIALKCLEAGRHVVCEKPLAITTDECDAMIAAAEKNDVVLSTYHNRHWDGCILDAVKRVGSGVIGDVFRIDVHMCGYGKPGDWWRSSRSISGGILFDWGVHLLEYSLQIMDAEIVEVTGFAKTGFWNDKSAWKEDTNEDEAFLVVRFRGGAWLTLVMSSIDSNPRPGLIEITGTKGTYIMGGETWKTVTQGDHGAVRTEGPVPPGEGWRFYQNIADHLTKGAELVITPEWARRPIHILDLAVRSAKEGRAIEAKYA